MGLVDFLPRAYQKSIAESCLNNNCLVVLPTGMGKTGCALIVAYEKLKQYPKSKVIFLAPTKPLINQHLNVFKKHLRIEGNLSILSGEVGPLKRKDIFNNSTIIFSTPQTIINDLIKKRIDLKDVSLIIFDEAHHAIKDYSYTYIADKYIKQPKSLIEQRIIGLTASPGSDNDKVKEVIKNLFITKIETRTNKDADVRDYVQKLEKNIKYVELPPYYIELIKKLKKIYSKNQQKFKLVGITKPTSLITKKDLLVYQKKFRKNLNSSKKNNLSYFAISLLAQAIKLDHCIELLETQGISPLNDYIEKLSKEKSKASLNILKDPLFKEVAVQIKKYYEKGVLHPKLLELIRLVKNKKTYKILVFANYRSTINQIERLLEKEEVRYHKFVGQANRVDKGLKQKEQIEVLEKFKQGVFNVLIASSVAEEGLDIVETDYVVFYEPIPSIVRKVQRTGRTARKRKGTVIFLITRGTRDEAYYWSAYHKEKKMKRIIENLKK